MPPACVRLTPRKVLQLRSLAKKLSAALLLFVLITGTSAVQAHEVRPVVATLTFPSAGQFELALDVNLEALIAGIGSQHSDTSESPNAARYDALRRLSPDLLKQETQAFLARLSDVLTAKTEAGALAYAPDFTLDVTQLDDLSLPRDSILTLKGELPEGAAAVTWQLEPVYGDSIIRVLDSNGEGPAQYLTGGSISPAFQLPPEALAGNNNRGFVLLLITSFMLSVGAGFVLFLRQKQKAV